MAVQLFRLRGVPDDEAEEVRALLRDNAIDFYETPAGNWGISMPALWLPDERQLSDAKALLSAYQESRARESRAAYERLRREGRQRRLADMVHDDPLRFVLYVALIAVVAYLSIWPFVEWARQP